MSTIASTPRMSLVSAARLGDIIAKRAAKKERAVKPEQFFNQRLFCLKLGAANNGERVPRRRERFGKVFYLFFKPQACIGRQEPRYTYNRSMFAMRVGKRFVYKNIPVYRSEE